MVIKWFTLFMDEFKLVAKVFYFFFLIFISFEPFIFWCRSLNNEIERVAEICKHIKPEWSFLLFYGFKLLFAVSCIPFSQMNNQLKMSIHLFQKHLYGIPIVFRLICIYFIRINWNYLSSYFRELRELFIFPNGHYLFNWGMTNELWTAENCSIRKCEKISNIWIRMERFHVISRRRKFENQKQSQHYFTSTYKRNFMENFSLQIDKNPLKS